MSTRNSVKTHSAPEVEPSTRLSSEPNQTKSPNGNVAKLSLEELEAQLHSSADGLSQAEAEQRLAQYGYNELIEKDSHPLLKFLSYFWGPIPWMIEGAVILSALVRHWADLAIILALLLSMRWSAFGKSTRRAIRLPPSRPNWLCRLGSGEIAPGG